jgi:hypothetical protein
MWLVPLAIAIVVWLVACLVVKRRDHRVLVAMAVTAIVFISWGMWAGPVMR